MTDHSNFFDLWGRIFTHDYIPLVVVGGIVGLLALLFFCITLYTGMKKVPHEKRRFPAWFVWIFFVPVASIVFMWIMLPFGIPASFSKATEGNVEAEHKTKMLFGIGLAIVILISLSWIHVYAFGGMIAALVLFIIYWVLVAQFKRDHLNKSSGHH
jgi:cobalamin synthase